VVEGAVGAREIDEPRLVEPLARAAGRREAEDRRRSRPEGEQGERGENHCW
jgi:hypothetical protein